ncbi:hypothetical protein CVS30_14435 [Arthrobacter psychrolactophilus]|uniref:Polysaccharide pyruvyl transferase domain-containing protein n=1 Tax=Arthrobacter psychrolactophilus TaxID=92442 RepID=A0A2V5ILW4_9MICC|nr:polysaccharide pyruvyl transferase family protein [Arthrobacter psychrolactophilus]PYI37595.1 hypothetical protein CVS30_14435 [Arthrobacter psychrolactophilus]
MTVTSSLYWWKPFSSARDMAISTAKYGTAWAHLAIANRNVSNFGDEVSRHFLQELTGESFRWRQPAKAEYLGIGSVLNSAIRSGFSGTIIGSGLRRPLATDESPDPSCNFIGVRGHLTAKEVGLPPEAAIGDPGLLARSVFSKPNHERQSAMPVLIPHFEVLNSKSGRSSLKALRSEGWDVILPNTPPAEVARAVRQAPFVASSSLHGYIFAHALDTPTTLLEFRDESGEPDFKFRDYLSVFGLEPSRTHARDLSHKTVGTLIDQESENSSLISQKIDSVLDAMYKTTFGKRK